MKLELSDNTLYLLYLKKRETLPLYYCHLDASRFDKGYYRCEMLDNGFVKVYDTVKGTRISKFYFKLCFKKPSKLSLFLHEHFAWL